MVHPVVSTEVGDPDDGGAPGCILELAPRDPAVPRTAQVHTARRQLAALESKPLKDNVPSRDLERALSRENCALFGLRVNDDWLPSRSLTGHPNDPITVSAVGNRNLVAGIGLVQT
jgi:hypothetical protein